ncbi:MAG: biotin/lipoyl-binding protein [Pseudomonadota bacterium]
MNNKKTRCYDLLVFKIQLSRFFFRMTFLFLLICLLGTNNVLAQETVSGYHISSPVSGVIKKVYVKTGKTVKQGELLLEYDNTLIDSNLAEAKAQINLAKINLSEAKKELERADELYERTVLSEHDLQLAKVLYSKAAAQFAGANNQLVHARWERTHSKLYAPFNGLVIKVFSYQGQYVNNKLTAQTLLILTKN